MDIFEKAERAMGYRSIDDCNEIREAQGAEIDAVRRCAAKKVERSTLRWWISLLLPILAGMLFAGVAYAFSASGRIAKTEASAESREKRLDRIEGKIDRVLDYQKAAAK